MNSFIFKMGNGYFNGSNKGEVVEFCTYGGGFVRRMSQCKFDEHCTVVDGLPNDIIPCWVSIDSTRPLKAYANPLNRWNGWAMPLFTQETCQFIINDLLSDMYTVTRYDGGYTISEDTYPDDNYNVDDEEININGETLIVNSLVSGLVWEIVQKDARIVAFLFMNEVSKLLTVDERAQIDHCNRVDHEDKDSLKTHPKIKNANILMNNAIAELYPENTEAGEDFGLMLRSQGSDLWNDAWEIAKDYGYSNL